MILPLLLMTLAADQAAPAGKLPTPVNADSGNILHAPTRSLRSATAAGVAGLPTVPTSFRFQCSVSPLNGEPTTCLLLDDLAKPATTTAEFEKRAAATAASASPAARVALQRVLFTRVRPTEGATAEVQMIFTESVSAKDVIQLDDAKNSSTMSDIEMDERPDGTILGAYYPASAMKASLQTRVRAKCRVLPDRSLFCRNATLVSPDSGITPAMESDFRNAAYQVLGAVRLSPLTRAGEPVVGRDVDMTIGFAAM